jgi:hypothetical protein
MNASGPVGLAGTVEKISRGPSRGGTPVPVWNDQPLTTALGTPTCIEEGM